MASDKSPYIEVRDAGQSKSGLTRIWTVHNIHTGEEIGFVRWHGPWRKYVFEDYGASFYDWQCLRQIADFIEAATAGHKK